MSWILIGAYLPRNEGCKHSHIYTIYSLIPMERPKSRVLVHTRLTTRRSSSPSNPFTTQFLYRSAGATPITLRHKRVMVNVWGKTKDTRQDPKVVAEISTQGNTCAHEANYTPRRQFPRFSGVPGWGRSSVCAFLLVRKGRNVLDCCIGWDWGYREDGVRW
jgi:hypothetical protein